MRDRVVKSQDSLCEKIRDGFGGIITGVGGLIRFSQKIADNDRQMMSNMLNGDIT